MKHIFNKLIFILTIGILFTACDHRDLTVIGDDNANSTLTLSETALILGQYDDGQEVLTASWTTPDYGFDAVPEYELLIDFAGGDFTNAKNYGLGAGLTKIFTKEILNSALLGLGAEPNSAMDFDFKVKSKLSDYESSLSDAKTITITTYPSILDLSTTWGVVGSATPGSWDGPDLPFFQTGEANIYAAYVTLTSAQIKFRENNDWTLNYGDDGADGTLEEGGANIDVTAGSYKIVMNLNDLTYTMESFSWGLVGDATPNGWDGPDTELNYDEYSDTFRGLVTLTDGNMKFRMNNDWAVNFGDDGADGTLETGGADIAVNAGTYLVTLNLTDPDNPFYSLEETDIWGIVGDATPNGWDGPDAKFTRDFSSNDEIWILNDITLTDGLIKFRTNDSWDNNLGDTDNDGSLDAGGSDIPIDAGTYSFRLDFSDSANPTYTRTP